MLKRNPSQATNAPTISPIEHNYWVKRASDRQQCPHDLLLLGFKPLVRQTGSPNRKVFVALQEALTELVAVSCPLLSNNGASMYDLIGGFVAWYGAPVT